MPETSVVFFFSRAGCRFLIPCGRGCCDGSANINDCVSHVFVAHQSSNGFLSRLFHGDSIATAIHPVYSYEHEDVNSGEESGQDANHYADDRDRYMAAL